MEFIHTAWVKAKKPYACVMCGGAIAKGDVHMKKLVKNGYSSNHVEAWRIHAGCKDRAKVQAWETIR